MTHSRRYPKGLSDSAASDFVGASTRAEPDALADLFHHGYSEDEIFTLVVPKRTLARRKAAHEPLTIEETDKRNGKVISVARMTVDTGGKTMKIAVEDKLRNTTANWTADKQ